MQTNVAAHRYEALDGLRGVRVTNRWMDESEIGGALAAADIVVLPYLEASQSGVAASAATAGVPWKQAHPLSQVGTGSAAAPRTDRGADLCA